MIRRFSLDKMRHQMVRDVPDAIWRTFTHQDSPLDYNQWWSDFGRAMKLKHGENHKEISLFRSDIMDHREGGARCQAVAVLYDNNLRGRRVKRIAIHPEMMKKFDEGLMSVNDIRRGLLGMREI